MRRGEGGVIVVVIVERVEARLYDDAIGHGRSGHKRENGSLRSGAAATGERRLEEGFAVSEEASAGGGVDVTSTFRAHNGAFPAICATADDARGRGG